MGDGGRRGGSGRERTARKGRVRRWGVRCVALCVVLMLVGVVVVTQTSLIGLVVVREIEKKLGVDARVDRCRLTLDGRLVAEGFEMDLRGVGNERASEFIRVDRAEVTVDFSRLFGPQIPAEHVEVEGLFVRLALDASYVSNVTAIELPPSTGYLPGVRVADARIELGEYDDAGYRVLETVTGRGSGRPLADGSGMYAVRIIEGPRGGEDTLERLDVAGELNVKTQAARFALTGLDFADWSTKTAPHGARDLWRYMAVAGRVDQAVLEYSPEDGIALDVRLESVDLNVPINLPRSFEGIDASASDGPLAMRDVTGDLVFTRDGFTADLRGMLEALDARLTMAYDGYEPDAAFDASIDIARLPVRDRDKLLAVAPEVVEQVYARFGEPTGELSGGLVLARGERGGEITARGSIEVMDAALRFENLPYPVSEVSGRVDFDSDSVDIVGFTGVGPTGARVTAEGFIRPPGDGAEVSVDVTVRGMPSDEHLLESLPSGPREAYETILNAPAYEALVERGLVRRPGDAGSAPVFELGGVSDVDIRIRRAAGADSRYRTFATVRIPEARALVDGFPYPAVCEDVLIEVEPGVARVDIPRVRGLHGGSGSIGGEVRFDPDDGSDVRPAIDVVVRDVPVDALLLHALPGEPSADAPGASLEEVLGAYEPEGVVDVSAEVSSVPSGENAGDLALDIGVALKGLTIAMPGVSGEVMTGVGGSLAITRDSLVASDVSGTLGSTRVTGFGEASFGDGPGVESFDVTIGMEGLHLPKRVERFSLPLVSAPTEQIGALRETYAPSGVADGSLRVWTRGDGEVVYRGVLERMRGVGLDVLAGRAEVERVGGRVVVEPGVVRLEGVGGGVAYEGEAVGAAEANGSFQFAELLALEAGALAASSDGQGFEVEVTDAELGSGFVRGVVRSASGAAADFLEENAVSGAFDATVRVTSDAGGFGSVEVEGRPRTLALTRGGERAVFDEVRGFARFGATGGAVDLAGSGAGMSAGFEGSWFAATESVPAAGLEGALDIWVDALTPGVRALFPVGVAGALDAIEMESGAPLRLERAALAINRPPESVEAGGVAARTWFDGVLETESASILTGVRFEGIEGRAAIRVEAPATYAGPADDPEAGAWSVSVEASRATAFGKLPLTDVRTRVESGAMAGSVVVPVFVAESMDGRVTGEVSVFPGSAGDFDAPVVSPLPTWYRVNVIADGLLLGELLASGLAPTDDEAPSEATNESRGILTVNVGIEGYTGYPDTRRGRVLLRVQPRSLGGSDEPFTELIALPGVLEVAKLTNLRQPISGPINFAYADAFIRGDEVLVRDLSLENYRDRSVAIIGAGSMSIASLEVDLSFTTQVVGGSNIFGLGGRSLLNEVIDTLRNEVATARVTGPVDDPRVRIETFPATQSLFDAIIHGDAVERIPEPLSPLLR